MEDAEMKVGCGGCDLTSSLDVECLVEETTCLSY